MNPILAAQSLCNFVQAGKFLPPLSLLCTPCPARQCWGSKLLSSFCRTLDPAAPGVLPYMPLFLDPIYSNCSSQPGNRDNCLAGCTSRCYHIPRLTLSKVKDIEEEAALMPLSFLCLMSASHQMFTAMKLLAHQIPVLPTEFCVCKGSRGHTGCPNRYDI